MRCILINLLCVIFKENDVINKNDKIVGKYICCQFGKNDIIIFYMSVIGNKQCELVIFEQYL